MIWIQNQKKELYYCSSIKLINVTSNQFMLMNQSKDVLGEFFILEDALNALEEIKKHINSNCNEVFIIPPKIRIDQ